MRLVQTPHGASRLVHTIVCFVGKNPTCSVPEFQGCESLWSYDYGHAWHECTPSPPRLGEHLAALRAWCKQGYASSVKTTRSAPSRLIRAARVYGHTPTAMHGLSAPPPPLDSTNTSRGFALGASNVYLVGENESDVLSPGVIGIRGSVVIRLRP